MNDLVPASDIAIGQSDLPDGSAAENPLLIVHRHLRGRYRLVGILAVLLGLPLAVVGFLAVPPMYTSTGMVRVAPQIRMMIYENIKEAQVPPYFESFVGTQAAMIGSRRVLDAAVDDADLKNAGWPGRPDGLAQLIKDVEVVNRRNTELILVTVHHKKPELAQAAVNAILTVYDKVRRDSTRVEQTDKEQFLGDRQLRLTRELESKRQDIISKAQLYATDDVEQVHVAKLAEIVKIDNKIHALDLELAARGTGDGKAAGPGSDDMVDLGLVLGDAAFAKLKDEEQTVATELERMGKTLQPEHREMKAMQRRYDAVHAEVMEMRQKLLAMPHDGKTSADPAAMTLDDLKSLRERYIKLRDTASVDAMQIEHTKEDIAALKDQFADLKQNLDETSRALDQINTERSSLEAGRASIFQRGDLPIEPSTDRRIPLAVVGLLGGGALGVGVVLMLGMAKGGFRYIDELERAESSVPLLGTVPDLKSADAEHESMAALSIHHLRNILQLQFERSPGGKVFTITSAAAGDGKTSLAIALAMSFAATGRRTLIIDTDLVGRGLSRQLEMSGIPGLCDALRAEKINGDIHATKVSSLWAMPAGVVQGFVPEHLSATTMGKIIKELRKQYDAIVLDTGPILGSLEANVVAPASDGVVVVVSHGQSAKSVRASIQRLRRLGAPCSGLIFNRAMVHDFDRSLSTASVSARSIKASAQAARRAGAEGRAALIRAVGAPAASDSAKDSGAT